MPYRYLMAIFCPLFFLGLCFSSYCLAQNSGQLYVLGMGPNGPDLTAPRAMKLLQKADKVLCHPDTKQKFQDYIPEEKYAFNPWKGIHGGKSNQLRKKDYQKWLKRVAKRKKELKEFVMEKINKGQTVAILDGGDPCVYGPALYWLLEDFPRDQLEVIPGMSAFNAASAALEKPMLGDNGFVILTSPHTLLNKKNSSSSNLFKDLSNHNPTFVLYMALNSMDKIVQRLKKYYPNDLPAAVVYYAGYQDKEKVIRGTITNINEKIKKYGKEWLGLVIIGKCLST